MPYGDGPASSRAQGGVFIDGDWRQAPTHRPIDQKALIDPQAGDGLRVPGTSRHPARRTRRRVRHRVSARHLGEAPAGSDKERRGPAAEVLLRSESAVNYESAPSSLPQGCERKLEPFTKMMPQYYASIARPATSSTACSSRPCQRPERGLHDRLGRRLGAGAAEMRRADELLMEEMTAF